MAPKNKQNIGLGQFARQGAMLFNSRVLPGSAAATFGQQKKERDAETALRNGLLAGSNGAAQTVTKRKSEAKTRKATEKETADDEVTTTTACGKGGAKGRRKAKKGDKDENAADDKDTTNIAAAAAAVSGQTNKTQCKKTIKFIPRHIEPSKTTWGLSRLQIAEQAASRAPLLAYPTDKMTITMVDGVLTANVIKALPKPTPKHPSPHHTTVRRQHGGRHVIVVPKSSARGRKSTKELVESLFGESEDDDVEVHSHDEADASQSRPVAKALATTQKTASILKKQKPVALAPEVDYKREENTTLEESNLDQTATPTQEPSPITKHTSQNGSRTRRQHKVSFALSSDDEDVTSNSNRRLSTMAQNLIQICEDGDESDSPTDSNNHQPTRILRNSQPKFSPSLSKENQDIDSLDDLNTANITNYKPAVRKTADPAHKKSVTSKPEPKRARRTPSQSDEELEEIVVPPSKKIKTASEAAEPTKKAGPVRKKGVARAVAKPKQKPRFVMEEVTDDSE